MTDPTDGNPPSDTERHNAKMARKKQARDKIMATKPFSVSPDDSVSFAIDIIREKRIGCLIVSKADELLGILSYLDLLDALKRILDKPARESAA